VPPERLFRQKQLIAEAQDTGKEVENMFTFKKVTLLLLALLVALAFAACTPDSPADEPIEEPPYEENGDDGYILPVPPIGELPDDIDWSRYPVIVDGVGVSDASFEMVGDDEIFPTHVSLMPLESVLGVDVFWNMQTNEVSFQGLNGFISFVVGSADFTLDGEVITLEQESLRIDDEIYLPLAFFRDVFGAGSAYFSGGHVYIHTEGGDMY